MGLLDDAIREHLELKRRHGASPDDLERQEREALGAARGGEFAAPSPAYAAEDDATRVVEPAEVAPDEDVTRIAPAADEVAPPPEPEVPEPAAPGYDEDPWLEEEPDEVPAGEALERPAEEEDDVLEETPDFLQETPEHDRLWFEQRPPRDFDWDK